MTRANGVTTDVATIAAGEATDALVAERVLGACAHRDINGWYREGPEGDRTLCCGQCHQFPNVPRYSTDLAIAWKLLIKISGDYHIGVSGGGTIVVVRFDDFYEQLVEASAETAALAICRAALLLKELEASRVSP